MNPSGLGCRSHSPFLEPPFGICAKEHPEQDAAIALHGLDLSEPQPFVGYRTPGPNEWFPPGSRRIEVEATHDLMVAVGRSKPTNLLQRSIEAYRRALQHWIPESRLLAGEFLYIAAETLSRFLMEGRAASRGITPKNLAQLENAPNHNALRRRYLADEIFDGDAKALAAVEKASNGFEHGYWELDAVRSTLDPVLDRSMGLVRRALIVASGVPAKAKNTLLADEYETPRGLVPVLVMVEGELAREDAAQPPPTMEGGAAVELEWTSPSPDVSIDPETGEVEFSIPYEAKPVALPPNARLDRKRYVIRAAHVRTSDDSPPA